jgi:DNA repair protein RadA/Sms
MVDTVLYFEGDTGHGYRILRTTKNRYGSTNEIGVFEMSGNGLLPVENPSRLFLTERPKGASGSVVMAAMEGLRPLLVEIQALVSGSGLVNPRRTAIGTDSARVALLVAVLEKIVGLQLYDQDIYVNVAGGLRIAEPAADLALLAALASSFKNKAIDAETVVFGEVGLAGEVRATSAVEARLNEARKLGFKRCILPKANESELAASGLKLHPVKTVREALDALF